MNFKCNEKGARRLFFLIMILSTIPLYAQRNTAPDWRILAGTDKGLFGIDWAGKSQNLWQGGQVKKIIKTPDEWIMLCSDGILASGNLKDWESRNQGLPVKIIKVYANGEKTFLPVVQEIKDLEINPLSPDTMVCATKDQIFLTQDSGRNWTSLGSPPYLTNGIKAVAAANLPDGRGGSALTVFAAHSTYGLFYINAGVSGAKWTEIGTGLEKLETTANTDEISDIAVRVKDDGSAEIFASQTFRRRIYRLDWERRIFIPVWGDKLPFGTVDSLDPGKNSLRFIREGEIAQIDFTEPAPAATASVQGDAKAPDNTLRPRPDLTQTIRTVTSNLKIRPDCVLIQESRQKNAETIAMSELWLLDETSGALTAPGKTDPIPGRTGTQTAQPNSPPFAVQAWGREGLYLPVNRAMDNTTLKKYLDIIASRKLNMIVIDMKDDYGRLRFTPNNPAISEKGRVFHPLDIDAFLAKMKALGIYTVARIVVFKDPVLAARNDNKYAVWDARNNKPWAGYRDTKQKKSDADDEKPDREDLTEIIPADDPEYEIVRTYYDERWVDPYSEEVWEYIANISEELAARGFDEIQYDYIRFPTDGINLADARFRWQDKGMDMESAILSFLRHIRARVSAPISIDIYGANGWYRTGARTGQEVELMAPWVDVICPMYYPSHFEQNFLAQAPEEQRPYRIYYQGIMRTSTIGRGQVIVRPWVQAFYLNVSYDKKYYGGPLGTAQEYVRREIEGVRAAGDPGFTYWNNSGRYDDIFFDGD